MVEWNNNRFALTLSFTFLMGVITAGCTGVSGNMGRSAADSLYSVTSFESYKYDIRHPEEKLFLPYVLEEISALSYFKGNILACVQDENGKVFFYDYMEKKIVHTTLFEYSGDYEGIEIVDDMAYIVKSNGELYSVPVNFDEEKRQATNYDTPFKSKNDIEGLGYDPLLGQLLLVTKDEAGIKEKKDKDSRGVYAYDLEKMKLIEKPKFIITRKERKEFYKAHKPKNSYDDKRLLFKPSAIAVHPHDGNYYILASVGKILMVVSPEGEIQESYAIPPGLLTQPEGICFTPDGTMFIASEGEGDRGYILRYEMKR